MPTDRNRTALAAEFFVAAELLRQGHIVTITFGKEKAVDLLVCHKDDNSIARSIDVKGLAKKNPWALGTFDKPQMPSFFVFCLLNTPGEQPRYFIVPSSDVNNLVEPASNRKSYWIPFNKVVDYESRWELLWE
ncbi:MAG TPA: hypothetical protein ENL08_05825 [Bacteroidetes bacterium]|nr:hypothetical protein [Bacteroidota bacterium]